MCNNFYCLVGEHGLLSLGSENVFGDVGKYTKRQGHVVEKSGNDIFKRSTVLVSITVPGGWSPCQLSLICCDML